MKKTFLALALLGLSASSAFAGDYLTDSNDQIVKSGTGLCWRTGYWTPAGAVKECDPEYFKEEKPAPTKTVVQLSADVLFKFNSAELSLSGKQALDQFIAQIPAHTAVEVVGHTDRIGSKAYNDKLSLRRADTVKSYLLNKRASNNVSATGVGFSQPSGDTAQCTGNKVNKKLIDCLAPDRRVIITIVH